MCKNGWNVSKLWDQVDGFIVRVYALYELSSFQTVGNTMYNIKKLQ